MSPPEEEKKQRRERAIEIHVAKVQKHDGPIVLPEKMSLDAAIEVLQRKRKYDSEKVAVSEVMPKVFPWDGALAMEQAIVETFGYAMQSMVVIKTLFGKLEFPPEMRTVEIAPNKTKRVPWGRFSLPGIEGWLEVGFPINEQTGRIDPGFRVRAEITHRDEDTIKKLIERCRQIATSDSIYRGQAISIRFPDKQIPAIEFLNIQKSPPIFSKQLEQAIDTNILTVIRHTDVVRDSGIPCKRGILLAGEYGTGKTLTANEIAMECVRSKHNWTFFYVREIKELHKAFMFAQDYQPAVVFCEDVDRIAGVDRTAEVNELLNTLDGIGNKSGEIMTILTSNHPENINPAMRRPGRIDVVLEVKAPDAEAVRRLFRLYGGSLIPEHENLEVASRVVENQRPAVIREVVERAKLEAIRRAGGMPDTLVGDDLEAAGNVLLAEQKLFQPKTVPTPPIQQVGGILADEIAKGMNKNITTALK